MAFFRSQEEREEDERRRQEADRRAAEHRQLLEASAREAAEREALAASPAGRARAAFTRGDRFFQVELEVSALTGYASMWGSSDNQVTRTADGTDVLGRIEDEGWRLEHTGFVFVETGSTSTDRVLFSGEGTVTRGMVTGVYLFRRDQRPATA